jgi:hypothetical protein
MMMYAPFLPISLYTLHLSAINQLISLTVQCSDPWLVCRHKEAPNDISAIAETFGRVPVRIRDWVRQILVLPGGNSAFAVNGNVAFFGTTDENVDVVIHESAHCLDGFAAFGEVINSMFPSPLIPRCARWILALLAWWDCTKGLY